MPFKQNSEILNSKLQWYNELIKLQWNKINGFTIRQIYRLRYNLHVL